MSGQIRYILRELQVISLCPSFSLSLSLAFPLQLADIAVTEVVRFPVCKEGSHISNISTLQSGSPLTLSGQTILAQHIAVTVEELMFVRLRCTDRQKGITVG